MHKIKLKEKTNNYDIIEVVIQLKLKELKLIGVLAISLERSDIGIILMTC